MPVRGEALCVTEENAREYDSKAGNYYQHHMIFALSPPYPVFSRGFH